MRRSGSTTAPDDLRRLADGDATWTKLQSASRDLLGGDLLLLVCRGEDLLEVFPTSEKGKLPGFCRELRSSRLGRKRCATCRSLLTFASCYRGLIDYVCHGGVTIISAPVALEGGSGERVVVASCAFADPDRKRGWRNARSHAEGLGIDLRILKREYQRLPTLEDDKARVGRTLVDLAATVLTGIARTGASADGIVAEKTARTDTSDRLEQVLRTSLFVAHDGQPAGRRPSGERLVEMVRAMVRRNPALPFTVEKIARAAGLTPNHFTTVFRRHAGVGFSRFLAAERIALGQSLLRDLSLNISQVVQRSGFRDASYFTRRFKSATGRTPRDWRDAL